MNRWKRKVIVRANATDFEVAVNDAIADGWRPQGGVSVVRSSYIDRKGYEEYETF